MALPHWKGKYVIVVTGGAGYIGSVVLDNVDKLCRGVSLCIDNLTYADEYHRYMFNNIDITDREALHNALDRHPSISCIIHLAAIVGDGACNVDPARTVAVNVDGTRNIVDWVKKKNESGRKVRLVYASTCSVYGESDGLLNEESVANPISLYAETKLIGEGMVKEVEDHMIFRLGTIFGLASGYQSHSRIRSDLVINAMSFNAALGQPINVYGKDQWRPFIHVMDVGRLISIGTISSFRGTYILSKENLRLGDVAEQITYCIDDASIIIHEGKAQDMRNYRVDNSKATKLGLCADTPIHNGITQIRDAIKNKRIKNPWLSKYNNAKYLQEMQNVRS